MAIFHHSCLRNWPHSHHLSSNSSFGNPVTRVMSCHHTRMLPSTHFLGPFPRSCFDSSLGDVCGKILTFVSMLNPQLRAPRRLNVKLFHNLLSSFRKLPSHLLRSRSSSLADGFHCPPDYHSRMRSTRRR